MRGPVVRLRPATDRDASFLLELRNDLDVRRQSRRLDVVLPEEHRAWLAQTLASPDRHLFTVEADARPVGQVRLDKRGSEVEVSISLVPEARGRGIGSQAIGLANGVARELGGRRATAVIRDGNLASLRAFTSLGYIENRREGQLIYLSMVLLDD